MIIIVSKLGVFLCRKVVINIRDKILSYSIHAKWNDEYKNSTIFQIGYICS